MRIYALIIGALILLFPTENFSQQAVRRFVRPINATQNTVRHSLSFTTAFLVQAQPIRQISTLSTNENFYASDFSPYPLGNAAGGFAIDFAYEAMLPNGFLFRLSTGLESAGYLQWVTDLGGGVRIFIARNIGISFEGYLSIVQTSSKLGIVGSNAGNNAFTQSLPLYMGLFGFKGRIAIEIPMTSKFYMRPYISYAAYPWLQYNLRNHIKSDLFINGILNGIRLDAFQLGLEFAFTF